MQGKGFRLPFIFLSTKQSGGHQETDRVSRMERRANGRHICVYVTFLGHVTSESCDATATAGAQSVMGVCHSSSQACYQR
jgi:hypothetical protein